MESNEIELLIKQKNRIENLVKGHSERLNDLPSLPNGLTPNEIKNSDFYKFHKEEYDKHFQALRNFNSELTNKQKKKYQIIEKINYKDVD